MNNDVKKELNDLLEQLQCIKNFMVDGNNRYRTVTVNTWITNLINQTAQFKVLIETYDIDKKEDK